MKTKLLLLLSALFTTICVAQSNGWHQYAKPNEVYKILQDNVNTNEIHLGTDIGYIRYNLSTNQVTDFLNFTSHITPIGRIGDIAINPTNNNLAITLRDGIAIYDGITVTKYAYHNSDLTLGETTSQFTYLEIEYGINGELYVFKQDVKGYQVFNNNIFNPEVATTFSPQDIKENNAGTKVYFAGANDGLWELDKATSTIANYTSTNSALNSNFLLSLFVDSNDLLYVGGYQDLNTLTQSGTWETYQQTSPIPVWDISVNESNGDVLANCSQRNGFSYGLNKIDLATNSWVRYTDDNTNCLNVDRFFDAIILSSGNIITSKIVQESNIYSFNPDTNTCADYDINYIGAADISSLGYSSINTRQSNTPNAFDIGFTNFSGDFEILTLPDTSINGMFPSTTTISAPSGTFFYDVISAGDYFIVTDNNNQINSIDENENMLTFALNLPVGTSINKTKKANNFISGSNCTLVFNAYQGLNTKVFATTYDFNSNTSTDPFEIFSTNRDVTEPVLFDCTETINPEEFACSVIKKNTSGNMAITQEIINTTSNTTISISFDKDISVFDVNFFKEPQYLGDNSAPHFFNSDGTELNGCNYNETIPQDCTTETVDNNNDGNNESYYGIEPNLENPEPIDIFGFILLTLDRSAQANNGLLRRDIKQLVSAAETTSYRNSESTLNYTLIPGTTIEDVPQDIILYSIKNFVYSDTHYATIIYTNYGLLIKSQIEHNSFTLSAEDFSLDNTIKLYPNPSNDIVTFSNKSIQSITVFDVNGRQVLTASSTIFSVKNLVNGIYIIKAKTQYGSEIVRKLIKN